MENFILTKYIYKKYPCGDSLFSQNSFKEERERTNNMLIY